MAKTTIVLSITKDAYNKQNANGKDFTIIDCAEHLGKDKNENEQTNWWRVILRYHNENQCKYLVKGAKIFVSGQFTIGAYKNQQGEAVATLTLWADDINIVAFAPKKDEPQQQQTNRQTPPQANVPGEVTYNDDLPF